MQVVDNERAEFGLKATPVPEARKRFEYGFSEKFRAIFEFEVLSFRFKLRKNSGLRMVWPLRTGATEWG
jgi:hypothetical protein